MSHSIQTLKNSTAKTKRDLFIQFDDGDNGRSVLNLELIDDQKSFYTISKRIIDVLIAVIGIMVGLPVMVLIACLIKLDSPGPVLFKHQRIGQNRRRRLRANGQVAERRNGRNLKGQPIEIYKFRTMRADVDPYAVCPGSAHDVRITRVGRFLRPLSLDELPQLLNVLKGDLSIVGPRPEMPFIAERYGAVEAHRLLVKPGITGLWQLYGSRTQFIHENLHYDLEYVRNRSLRLDLKILIKTFLFVLSFRNV